MSTGNCKHFEQREYGILYQNSVLMMRLISTKLIDYAGIATTKDDAKTYSMVVAVLTFSSELFENEQEHNINV